MPFAYVLQNLRNKNAANTKKNSIIWFVTFEKENRKSHTSSESASTFANVDEGSTDL